MIRLGGFELPENVCPDKDETGHRLCAVCSAYAAMRNATRDLSHAAERYQRAVKETIRG